MLEPYEAKVSCTVLRRGRGSNLSSLFDNGLLCQDMNHMEESFKFLSGKYNNNGKLVEIHEKYPDDKGHKKGREEEP